MTRKQYRSVGVLLFFLACIIGFRPVIAQNCTPSFRQFLPIIAGSYLDTREPTMGSFSIIRPEATTSLHTNPSVETNITGYTAVGGASIARSTTQQKRGAYSVAVTVGAGTTDGVFWGTFSTTSGQSYTQSVDVFAPVGMLMKVYFASTAAALQGSAVTFTGTGKWQRVTATFTDGSSTTRRVYISKNTDATTGIFYVDGWQIENLAYATTYCDGDQSGCTWSSTVHGSTSTRSAQYRGGGRQIDLESINAYLVSQQGTGMLPVQNQVSAYASIDGSYFQRQSVKERSFTIAVSTSGTSTAEWHANRQALIDLVRPDIVYPQQPFVLTYNGGGTEVRISCLYDGGLEMADGKTDIETVAIKCLAPDPFWTIDGNDGTALTVQQSVSNANMIIQRSPTGTWSAMGTGTGAGSGTVRAIVIGADGSVYAGGAIDLMGGVANTKGVAKWNGSAWTALSTGLTAGGVFGDGGTLAAAPNGDIYVAGAFDTAGGVAAANIAKWNGSAFTALGTGSNDTVLSMVVDGSGNLWAGGNFTSMGGVANTARIARWNGSAWQSVGTGGANSSVTALALAPNGDIIAGGNFTTIGGVSSVGLARYNGTAWTSLNNTASVLVEGIAFAPNGAMYVGGFFSSIGGISALNVAVYNGGSFSPLGAGLTTGGSFGAYGVKVDKNGLVYFHGDPVSSGTYTLSTPGVAIWNGSSWASTDVALTGIPLTVYSMAISSSNAIYLGYNSRITAVTGAVTQVTSAATANGYPVFTITGPSSGTARINSIINYTTNKSIYLNYTINAGETATLSLVPGNVYFSSTFQGNIFSRILPGSSMANFVIVPGVNNVGFYATSSTVTATVTWQERCWSIDASGV